MKEFLEEEYMATRRRLVKLTCDLCGRAAPHPSGATWESSYYDTDEVTVEVRHKKGVAYPEIHHGINRSFDLCPQCFEEKLIPWMESQGAKVSELEYGD